MAFPRISAKVTAAILSYADAKLTLRQISAKVGVHHTTVLTVFQKHGITPFGTKRSKEKKEKIRKAAKGGGSFEDIGRRAGVSHDQARRVILKDRDAPEPPPKKSVILPQSVKLDYDSFNINDAGTWGIISDIHIPCHDRTTLELFSNECRKRAVRGIIINGDMLDSHEISDHDKDPSMPRYRLELDLARDFIAWLRERHPQARIIFKHGNHEERLQRYIFNRAPALEGLEGVNLRAWLHLDNEGVEDLPGKRVIHLGKLHVVHGHEYRGGGGVNPARWLFLRARSVAVCGHFHRTSEHHERNIAMKYEAAWSMGCACFLHPQYAPLNSWNHGWGMCEVFNDGNFAFENKRVFEGRVV
jgi:predicted phosphodiesterase